MDISRIPFSLLPFMFFLSIPKLYFCDAAGIITSNQPITERETIISSNGTFKLGFFSPGNTSNRYVGIWYNKIPGGLTVVWVANRNIPLADSSGVFTIGDDRNLVVLDGKRNVVWTTNISNIPLSSHAELLDSGDLVLREGNSSNSNNNGKILWQSFRDPLQTLLPGMRLGINERTGDKIVLPSWKSNMDPSTGSFFLELDPAGLPQIIMKNGSDRHWRSGPWNGRAFIGVQKRDSVYLDKFTVLRDDEERSSYVTYSYMNESTLVRYSLNSQGILAEQIWEEGDRQWVDDWSVPRTECELYGKCGPFGFCNTLSSPICSCLRGFEPKSIEEWSTGNWSSGCMRRTKLQCERNSTGSEKAKTDGFLNFKGMKVPDFASWVAGWDLKQCEGRCSSNCSCIAYSYDTGAGCMWWSGNLVDIEKFSVGGLDLFIRVADSELDEKKNAKVIIIISTLIGLLTSSVLTYVSWRWMAKHKDKKKKDKQILLFDKSGNMSESSDSSKLGDNPELPILNFEKLAIATNNFDAANKLGQGGFGPVYKGKFQGGQEIAVKRLSKSSGQGSEEFKNEVVVISKLQHRNLVRLLGCCIEGEEKMLIYEYMPNKSLDAFIFDPTKRVLLDWRKRFEIIMGICRGIIYLHRDSRLRVIHRDLKASNILLDQELNAKISDFGMARIFGGDELQANTMRVVGTYGYMSPEYAMEGLFSEKSDVFSFGVLLLEIVSGKRNTSFYHHKQSWSLLGYAWKLWNEGKIQELIDPVTSESSFQEEILRCIHVGLLCVQDFAKDRPAMSSIVSMLLSEITSLPIPKQPAFTGGQVESDLDLCQDTIFSNNNVSITVIGGR